MNNGLLVVLSGPSGSGKDTILKLILEKMKGEAFLSVSMTTRTIRPGEQEGIDYYYVSKEQFQENISNNLMLEFAKYGSNYYGTPVGPVRKLLNEGKIVFLNIEVQGGANVKRLISDAIKIFIAPPSFTELENRLRNRGTETDDEIQGRLSIAKDELTRYHEYDYIVINDNINDAVEDVLTIVRAAQHKTAKMKNIICEVIENA